MSLTDQHNVEPTAGPWQWDESEYVLRPVDQSGDITAILTVESQGMMRRPSDRSADDIGVELAATRRLIKASPELLQAARNTVAYYARTAPGRACLIDEINPCGGLKHWGGGDGCPLCSARAAIAVAFERLEVRP